jgi:hypothetical protein
MMHNFPSTKYFLAFSLAISSYSCSEKIEIDLKEDHKRTLIVEGYISNNQGPQVVRLSATTEFYSLDEEMVSGAEVNVYESDTIEYPFTETSPGVYESHKSFSGRSNYSYTLVVSRVDIDNDGSLEEYTANTTMPKYLEADSIRLSFMELWDSYVIKTWAKDPPESMDYYMFKTFVNDSLLSDSLFDFNIADDGFFNGRETNGIQTQFIDENFGLKAGDQIKQESSLITKEYYVFLREITSAARGSNPMFSGPPANVSGNISNDAFGFFTAISSSYSTYTVNEEDLIEE